MKSSLLSVLALTLILVVPVNADIITINDPALEIPCLSKSTINGDDMVGMKVTAEFYKGGKWEADWVATGDKAGGAFGVVPIYGTWSLTLNGDSFLEDWIVTNNTVLRLVSITIDAYPGNTVFDIIEDPDLTPGSERGRATFIQGDPGYQLAYFAGIVNIAGSDPYGDLWRTLTVIFNNDVKSGESTTWKVDTDNICVPIPGSILLMGSGLLSLIGWRRFRKS
jgi:hypothetical protein